MAQNTLRELSRQLPTGPEIKKIINSLLEKDDLHHAREHIGAYRALVGTRGGDVALGTIRAMLADLFRKELAANAGEKSVNVVPRELVIQMTVDVYMTLLTWWLDRSATLPPGQIDAMFRRLATKGLFCDMGPTVS